MDGRTISKDQYRYGFQNQEKDDEVSGNGSSYTAEYWQYDTRIGRRWNNDPVFKEWESPYSTFGNNAIRFIDPNGADWYEKNGSKKGDKDRYVWKEGSDEIDGHNRLGAYLITLERDKIIVRSNPEKPSKIAYLASSNSFNILVRPINSFENQGVKAEKSGAIIDLEVEDADDFKEFTNEVKRNNLKFNNAFISNHHNAGGSFHIEIGSEKITDPTNDLKFLNGMFVKGGNLVLYQCTVIFPFVNKSNKESLKNISNISGANVFAPMYTVPGDYLFSRKIVTLSHSLLKQELNIYHYNKLMHSIIHINNGKWLVATPSNSKIKKVTNLDTHDGGIRHD